MIRLAESLVPFVNAGTHADPYFYLFFPRFFLYLAPEKLPTF